MQGQSQRLHHPAGLTGRRRRVGQHPGDQATGSRHVRIEVTVDASGKWTGYGTTRTAFTLFKARS
nr:hypothetical protein Ade03nite_40830 [Actinoplanes derwentensis]